MRSRRAERSSTRRGGGCIGSRHHRRHHGYTVLYFRSGDALDLAEKIDWALEHPGEMADMARRAVAHVRSRLTWDKIASQYDKLYQACLEQRCTP